MRRTTIPIEQLGLSVDAVTRGPDDVRGAVPGLPAELVPAFELAVRMLGDGNRGEKLAGVGFWFYGDRVVGSLFDDPTACGADRLVLWGLLRGDRLPLLGGPSTAAVAAELERTNAAPIHAIVDALTAPRSGWPYGADDGRTCDAASHPARPGAIAQRSTQASAGGHHLARFARDPAAAASTYQPFYGQTLHGRGTRAFHPMKARAPTDQHTSTQSGCGGGNRSGCGCGSGICSTGPFGCWKKSDVYASGAPRRGRISLLRSKNAAGVSPTRSRKSAIRCDWS